ncbi:MAG TPA: SprB repeat-containing protein, partial [Bacteroidia bacterium]|nr:SprB repeat-containing protein [Bacteroidia bacterium]
MKHNHITPQPNISISNQRELIRFIYLNRILTSALTLMLIFVGMSLSYAHSPSGKNTGEVSVDHQISPELKEMLQHFDKEIYFTQNIGQWPAHVLYKADFPLGQALVTRQGMIVGTFDPVGMASMLSAADSIEAMLEDTAGNPPAKVDIKGHGWLLNFLNSSPSMRISSHSPYSDVRNYFLGRDGEKHATNVRSFKEIWYNDVYNNIDVRYYPSAEGSLEYDIICRPGSDANQVAIEFDGIDNLFIGEQGNLVLRTSVGDVELPAPVVYQQISGVRKSVESKYLLADNVLKFDLGKYDHTVPLIIDPIALRWATWLTNNSTGDCHIHGICVDSTDGSIYTISRVSGVGLITVNAFQNSSGGDMDIIVSKYQDPATIGGAGTRVWQSYFGGNDYDNAYALEQGDDGNLYFTGITKSSNFPLLVGSAFTGSSVDKRSQSNYNIFVSKLNTSGTSVKSAVVGGNNIDLAFDIRVTNTGNVLVCGYTESTNLSSQFSGSGATNTNYGNADVLIFSINSDMSSINWIKNYGGGGDDKARIMLVHPTTNDIYVGGLTMSSNFPTVSPRQGSLGGDQSGFLQKLTSTGSTTWSSYFRSNSSKSTIIECMDFNAAKDKIYFGGLSNGLNSSNVSSSGVYSSSIAGGMDYFICRMTTNQVFELGTYLGGSGTEENLMGLKLDANDDVFVFGYSSSSNFPVTADALQGTNNGNSDKTFSKLSSNLATLEYSTFVGGSDEEYDPIGERGIQMLGCKTYTIISAESDDIPLTDGAITTNKLSSSSRTEPGLMVWSVPPDLSANTISSSQNICSGNIPGNFTGSTSSYVLPDITRGGNVSAHPSVSASVIYKWQISTDSSMWTNVAGGNTQNLSGSLLGTISQKTFLRRIVTGESCNASDSISNTITINVLNLSCSVGNHVSCNGGDDGSIQVTPSGGTAPYTYSGPTTGLSAGTYTITVTDDNGCTASCTVTISEPAAIGSSYDVTQCDSYSLPWGGTVTSSGSYSHTYTSTNGCDSVVTANVTIDSGTTSTSTADECDSYTWNGTTYTMSGTYTYSTTNAAGCDST